MKALRRKDGSFELIAGNPTLLSLDGQEKAPWFAVEASKREADFGVEEVIQPATPDDKIQGHLETISSVDGRPVANYRYEDKPVESAQTDAEILETNVGLSVKQIRAVLGI